MEPESSWIFASHPCKTWKCPVICKTKCWWRCHQGRVRFSSPPQGSMWPHLWVSIYRFSSQGQIHLYVHGHQVNAYSQRVSYMFVSLFSPRFPSSMLQNAHIQVFYSGWLCSCFRGPGWDWRKTNPVKFFQHSLWKLINIITAQHWQFFTFEFVQTCEDYQKTQTLVCVNTNHWLLLKLAVKWRRLWIAGVTVASKGASANV